MGSTRAFRPSGKTVWGSAPRFAQTAEMSLRTITSSPNIIYGISGSRFTMPSIFTLPPLEEGGPIARGGFDYQDHVAATICLEMLRDASIRAVWCETHDDLLADRHVDGQAIVEFIQVKGEVLNQLWSVARLCEREKREGATRQGTSIIEKQLAHDRGDELSHFRLVTLREPNEELSLLRRLHAQRDPAELRRLAAELVKRLGNFQSPKQNGLGYWVQNLRWDSMGSLEAVENINLTALEDFLLREVKVSLLLPQKCKLYSDLLEVVRRMSAARWGDGHEKKRIKRDELKQWVVSQVSHIPIAIGSHEAHELAALERESVARCEDRWRVLDVPTDIASNLARNPEVGLLPALSVSLQRTFTWLIGDFGSGKSLALERLYQQQLVEFRSHSAVQIPVFLEGVMLNGRNLRQEAEQQARRLGDPAVRGVFLVLDGVDQAGTEVGIDLLRQAHILSRTWQNSHVIVSSTSLPLDAYSEARIRLPQLSQPQSLKLIESISRNAIPRIDFIPAIFRLDISKPLICLLLATHFRETNRMPDSIGEVVGKVANKALGLLTRDFADADKLLMRLAASSTDRGGAPVPLNEMALTHFQIQPLLKTRLVLYESGSLAFTVTIFAHWFAAEAIVASVVNPADIIANTERRERWRYPLTVFAGTKSFDQVASIFDPLTRSFPAFAGIVIDDAVRNWPRQPVNPMPPPEELAGQMHRAVSAWSEGVAPLTKIVGPHNSHGDLLKLSLFAHNGYVTASWRDDSEAPPFRGALGPPIFDPSQGPVWSNLIGEQPASLWKITKGHIASDIRRLVQSRQLPNRVIARETIWCEACERTVRSAMRETRISLDELITARPRFRGFGRENIDYLFKEGIERLQRSEAQFLEAPYPQADRESTSGLIFSYYSAQRSLERTRAVYETAVKAYEQLVEDWFPKFAPRLTHFAILPARIHGILIPEAQQDHSGRTPFTYWFEPLPQDSQTEICIEIGTEQQAIDIFQVGEQRLAQVRTLRPNCAEWIAAFACGTGLSDIVQNDPCARIVYSWLESDLREVKWMD
jgi:hypothetical protein